MENELFFNITNNNCETLVLTGNLFSEYLEHPDLDRVEIYTQYNCCENINSSHIISRVCANFELEETLRIDNKFYITINLIGAVFTPYIDPIEFRNRFNIVHSWTVEDVIYIDETTFQLNLIEFVGIPDVINIVLLSSGLVNFSENLFGVLNIVPIPIVPPYIYEYTFTLISNEICILVSDNINVSLENNTILITPEAYDFSNEDIFLDGIYTITVIFYLTDGSSYSVTNCLFVDCTIGCRLAEFMTNNLGKPISTELAMIHFALIQAANCECECENLCRLFEYLWKYLSTIEIPIGCGC